ncbi:Hypp2389 [Branchiostoma lanceolatum]|uniref:Hypp2389 protein n=1 Tax=Branchiostoma lanceolatum TaxID=7740 RepID=A0A8K0EPR2_BRALA|nr:Hypp2389 [Branchiostoma lanceolatum]
MAAADIVWKAGWQQDPYHGAACGHVWDSAGISNTSGDMEVMILPPLGKPKQDMVTAGPAKLHWGGTGGCY